LCSKSRASRGRSLVEVKQSAKPLTTANATCSGRRSVIGERDDVGETLVIALRVVVLDELAEGRAQVALAERNDVPKTLFF
jgi:hypothetical protein